MLFSIYAQKYIFRFIKHALLSMFLFVNIAY